MNYTVKNELYGFFYGSYRFLWIFFTILTGVVTSGLACMPANSHGLIVSLTEFYSFDSHTAVVTVAHGFLLAPRFYFHMGSCKSLLQETRTGSIYSA